MRCNGIPCVPYKADKLAAGYSKSMSDLGLKNPDLCRDRLRNTVCRAHVAKVVTAAKNGGCNSLSAGISAGTSGETSAVQAHLHQYRLLSL